MACFYASVLTTVRAGGIVCFLCLLVPTTLMELISQQPLKEILSNLFHFRMECLDHCWQRSRSKVTANLHFVNMMILGISVKFVTPIHLDCRMRS